MISVWQGCLAREALRQSGYHLLQRRLTHQVPVEDAHTWHAILSKRSPGTHALRLIEGGDHNLRGHNDAVADIIGDWVQSRSLSPCAPAMPEPPRARM